MSSLHEPPQGRPTHLAIIMDGNGRWAEARGLPRVRGHEAGASTVRTVTRLCRRLGVKVLTLYSFSTENWRRPATEVAALMQLLARYLQDEREEILGNGIRLVATGQLDRLPTFARHALDALVAASSGQQGMTLNLALSYGGRQEIVEATRRIAAEVRAGRLAVDEIDERTIERHLWTAALPDPDLVIRTGGDSRLSNFLLWQAAYAEFVVSPKAWPDFGEDDLLAAFAEFASRERRFGRTGAQVREAR